MQYMYSTAQYSLRNHILRLEYSSSSLGVFNILPEHDCTYLEGLSIYCYTGTRNLMAGCQCVYMYMYVMYRYVYQG